MDATWQALGRLDDNLALYCPVRALKSLHNAASCNSTTASTAPLFAKPGTKTPMPYSSFIPKLRRLLQATWEQYQLHINPKDYGGRSFRRGALTELAKWTNIRRVAAHADHARLDSANVYVVDTIDARAHNSRLIASGFHD